MTRSRGIRSPKRWSPVEQQRLRRMYPSRRTADVAAALGRPIAHVYAKANNMGLRKTAAFLASPAGGRLMPGDWRGGATRFQKGHLPANKGLRRPGWARGRMRETQFKKGCMSGAAQHNYVPIGSHRVSKDGYLERKVTDAHPVPARRWIGVHRLVWESANGAVPAGHVVCFLPGRRSADLAAITLDALELVTRVELMRRNTVHNYPQPIPQLVQLRGALNRQINKRTKRREEQDV